MSRRGGSWVGGDVTPDHDVPALFDGDIHSCHKRGLHEENAADLVQVADLATKEGP
jgi:hypothetical protein